MGVWGTCPPTDSTGRKNRYKILGRRRNVILKSGENDYPVDEA